MCAACYRCGGSHAARDCRYRDSICNFCHKKGYIQHVCKTRLRQQRQSAPEQTPPLQVGGQQQHHTHKVDSKAPPTTTSASSTPPAQPWTVDCNMFLVEADRVASVKATVTTDGAQLQMDVDTGAALFLISKATYSKLWPAGRGPQLIKPAIRLQTYTGEELKLVGEASGWVQYQSQQKDLSLVVVKGTGPSLLGRDWLSKVRLN